jgi:hypothetical protein
MLLFFKYFPICRKYVCVPIAIGISTTIIKPKRKHYGIISCCSFLILKQTIFNFTIIAKTTILAI